MQLKIRDLVQEWLLDCTIRGFSPRTVKSYRNNMDRLINWAEEEHEIVNLEQLTAPIIKMFIMTLQQEQGIKGTYANSLIKTYRAFFVYVVDEYDVPNPMLKVRWCKEITPIITAFSDTEVKNLLNYYSHRDFLSVRNKTILTLFFGAGLRCAELCSLTADNIHDNFIQLIGKGKKERIVPIDAVMQKQLLKYKQAKDSFFADKTLHCDNLFISRTGRKLTNSGVEHMLMLTGEYVHVRSEIRCSPHTCRHWFAQAQIKNGCDIYTLSKLLGHSNIKITQTYLQSMMDEDIITNGLISAPLLHL